MPDAPIDILLALTLLILAGGLLFNRDLFASAVLFVAFGLAMSLVWIRLAAPDIALAEAAVGAGLTGTLVIKAVGQMPSGKQLVPVRAASIIAVIALAGALCAALLTALTPFVPFGPGLGPEARSAALELGLQQQVTAVLLVFRGYDTWLELAVLLTTLLAVLGSGPAAQLAERRLASELDPLLATFARLLLPVAVLLAGFLVWRGTSGPGGAFQGGALLASAIVLGYLAGMQVFRFLPGIRTRLLVVLGFTLPLLLTLPGLVNGEALLAYPGGDPGPWIPGIEVAVGLSVSFTLAALFAGSEPSRAA